MATARDPQLVGVPAPALTAQGESTTLPAWLQRIISQLDVPGEIETPGGEVLRFGASHGQPRFRIRFLRDDLLRRPQDEFSLGRAYVNGEIELVGDMLALLEARSQLADRFRMWPWLRFLLNLWLKPVTRANQQAIEHHYTLGNEFYFSFLDTRYRFYSQCLFARDDETLEQAAEHKLETTWHALGLRPGMRMLDIGAGWGGTLEYFCPRGIRMTGITLFENSRSYVGDLIQRQNLNGEISLQDFLTYQPQEPFDSIMTYGVIEHLPHYKEFFQQVHRCLKPGGRIYIDGSACKQKYAMSQFTRQYTWQGAHSFMVLPELVQHALDQGFQVEEVKQESHDYELTMLHWAQRLDRNREKIRRQWSEEAYRLFRLFLWGGCHAFRKDGLQAYHVVARKSA